MTGEQPLLEHKGEKRTRKRSWQVEPTAQPTKLVTLNVLYFVHEGGRMLLLRFMTAYFTARGIPTSGVGILQALGTLSSFFGELTWANLADTKCNFRTTVLCANAFGVAIFSTIPFIPHGIPNELTMLGAAYAVSSFGLSWVGIRDAFAVATLESLSGSPSEGARKFGRVRKFAALGWGLSGLAVGVVQDAFGLSAIFVFFGVLQTILMVTLIIGIKESAAPRVVEKEAVISEDGQTKATGAVQAPTTIKGVLCQPFVLVFFANVLFYGICTALQEVYEFVYLLRGFKPTPSSALLGGTLCVMTISELPVFHFADKLISTGFVPVYTVCQLLMCIRCFLYSILPSDKAWMVLLIEPFHGCTFAAMWAASVEFGRRISPKGARSRVQALISGTYFQVSQGVGALAWGSIITGLGNYESDKVGLVCLPEGTDTNATNEELCELAQAAGFRDAYRLCGLLLFLWSILWNVSVNMMDSSPLKQRPTDGHQCLPCGGRGGKPLKRLRTGIFYRRMVAAPSLFAPLTEEPDTPYTPAQDGKKKTWA